MAALGLWGLFQLLTGKGRWPTDTNRALPFGLLWAGLEWRLRRS